MKIKTSTVTSLSIDSQVVFHGITKVLRQIAQQTLIGLCVQKAYDFVDSLESLEVLKYSLATSYPRRVFTEETLHQSFEELGLSAQATLFVQSQDD